ncbi:hypothetical protein SAMN05421594_1919 [Chryseobacterium oleae]|uniref:Uncharacterized protein n=1 Tax=Chryseobacterium oleae TaxID=491207 RepID=A0A1I4XKL5_CHROL|nr:hypothetical protein SAMN05421594_1919 [Chryseobacterium oleae]
MNSYNNGKCFFYCKSIQQEAVDRKLQQAYNYKNKRNYFIKECSKQTKGKEQ